MAYTDFSLEDLEIKFGISNLIQDLFDESKIAVIEASERLKEALATAEELPVKSEKARSEMIVTPILLDLRIRNNKFFTIYSGDTLSADKEKGLVGECDFILAKETGSFNINTPIISIVEAKKNDIEYGIPQCAAQLIGAKIFNTQRNKTLEKIYGCITTGELWKFICLKDNQLIIDRETYFVGELSKLLSVFQHIIMEMKMIVGE